MSEVPTPKFKMGDTVYFASTYSETLATPCPDCNATGKWEAKSPDGSIACPISCPRCDGRGALGMHGAKASPTRPLTIGQVRIEWPQADYNRDRDPVSYMCIETGVGGGTIYHESDLFSDEDEAQRSADAKAAKINREIDEREPERVRRREIYGYTIKRALEAEFTERAHVAERRLSDILFHIYELDEHPIAERIDEYGNETGDYLYVTLTREQIEAVQNNLLRYDRAALRELSDHRRENA